MPEITARGFAIVTDGKVDMRTVCPHARGAVVNWLWVSGEVMLPGDIADELIFAIWEKLRGDATVQPVKVTVVLSAADD